LKKKFISEFILLSFLGGLTSLSLPPFNLFIINFFTFSIFFGLLFKNLNKKIEKKIFFFYGWFFGFGYFFTNLYWITISLSFDKNFSFLIPLALIFIPSFLALFYGSITLIFYLFNPKNILSAFFSFSVFFGIVEFIRGSILTGFPWNLIVYSFSKNLSFLSILSLIGTYSLNLIVISFFTAPAIYILRKSKKEIGVCIFLVLLPIIFFTHGNFQKKQFKNKELEKLSYTIRIIGSNISLERFNNKIDTEEVIHELISISSPVSNQKTFFVWPEGIIPNTYQNEMLLYADIFNKSFSENHLLGLGITKKDSENNENKFYNTFSIFDNKLNLIKSYSKIKLVPFGEFLPFENLLSKLGLKSLTNNYQSYSAGKKRELFSFEKDNKIKILPLICYEIIYSGNLSRSTEYTFIINISEDGWFGNSIGPYQHYAHTIFRSIEYGKYTLRSANNGISAIINPIGIAVDKININTEGTLSLNEIKDVDKTLFSKFGNKIYFLIILLYIFLIFSFKKSKNE